MADNTQQELSEFKDTLNASRALLVRYQERQKHPPQPHTSNDVVLIVAIDGLLTRLDAADPDTIEPRAIVKLTDDVQEVLKATRQFLQRQSAA